MREPYLSIIIPAYNEAKRLPLTLLDIDKRLAAAKFSYEILVINDGSHDNTAEIVTKMSRVVRNLHLVDNIVNRGKGGVVRQGMRLGKGSVRLFMDADNATTIDQFEQMIPFFDEGYGVVIGDRAIQGSTLEPPESVIRQIAGKLGNLWIQIFLLPGIWDTQCGFKAFTAEAAEKIFVLSEINGWGFDAEALALGKALGYRIKEVPVHWVARGGGSIKPSAYLHVLLDTVKIRAWLLMKHYKLAAVAG